jgi:hypothetical protein
MIMSRSGTVENLHTRLFAIEVNQECLFTNGRTDTLSFCQSPFSTDHVTFSSSDDEHGLWCSIVYDVLLFCGKLLKSSVRFVAKTRALLQYLAWYHPLPSQWHLLMILLTGSNYIFTVTTSLEQLRKQRLFITRLKQCIFGTMLLFTCKIGIWHENCLKYDFSNNILEKYLEFGYSI